MKNHHKTTEYLHASIFFFVTALLIVSLGYATGAFGQTESVQAQWTHGGENDLAGFHLFYKKVGDSYALGYNLPLSSYLAPPAYMSIPIALLPGDYLFVVTAYDSAIPTPNESEYSNEAILEVEDKVPGTCSGLIMRIPTP